MNQYIDALTKLKLNPDIERIDSESIIDINIFMELHKKGLVDAIDVSYKNCDAFIEPSINMDGLAFLEEHNRKDIPSDNWYKKPVGIIFLSVSAITIAWFVKHLLSPYIK